MRNAAPSEMGSLGRLGVTGCGEALDCAVEEDSESIKLICIPFKISKGNTLLLSVFVAVDVTGGSSVDIRSKPRFTCYHNHRPRR